MDEDSRRGGEIFDPQRLQNAEPAGTFFPQDVQNKPVPEGNVTGFCSSPSGGMIIGLMFDRAVLTGCISVSIAGGDVAGAFTIGRAVMLA